MYVCVYIYIYIYIYIYSQRFSRVSLAATEGVRLLPLSPTCHSLPPSEIDSGLFLVVLQAQKGRNYFTE